MAKFDADNQNRLSGLIGNIVISGNTVRRRPVFSKNHKWSNKQIQNHLRFGGVIKLYQQLKTNIVKPIWTQSSTKKLTAYNLFIKENIAAFSSDGRLKDPLKLKLSIGKLSTPFNIKLIHFQLITYKITLIWENDSNISFKRKKDRLIVVFYKDEIFSTPLKTEYTRSNKKAHIIIPKKYINGGFIYIFFGNQANNAFSPSWAEKLGI